MLIHVSCIVVVDVDIWCWL